MATEKYFKYVAKQDPNLSIRTVGIRLENSIKIHATYRDMQDVVTEAMKDFAVIRDNIRILSYYADRGWELYMGIEFDILDSTFIPSSYYVMNENPHHGDRPEFVS